MSELETFELSIEKKSINGLIKLLTSEAIDFLMSQKDGANYVILYQMICLLTINSNGELADYIGEVIIPFDAAKIQRNTKYFNIDTIRVALGLYQKLGLVSVQENGILKIVDFENLIVDKANTKTQSNKIKKISISSEGDLDISIKLQIETIFETWNKMKNTIHHYELNAVRKLSIKKALSKFTITDIIQAIKNYDMVLRSSWYFNYRWALEDFLNRKNGISTFTSEGSNWNSFVNELKKNPLLLPKEDLSQTPNKDNREVPQSFIDFLNNI